MDAIEHFPAIAGMRVEFREEFLMTADAVPLEDGRVFRPDHDGFVEILQGEALRVPIAVLCLREILPDEVMRRMTIVAGRNRMVR